MYYMFKDDPWGNKVPYMAANHKESADRILKAGKAFITKVIEVPSNVQSLIKM